MIEFKGCPKCQGDLHLSKDRFGKYMSCLQCGYLRDLEESQDLRQKTAVAGEKREVA